MLCRLTFVLGDRNQIRELLQSRPGKRKEPGTFFYCLIKVFQNESIEKQK